MKIDELSLDSVQKIFDDAKDSQYLGFRCTWLITRKCGLFSLSPRINPILPSGLPGRADAVQVTL